MAYTMRAIDYTELMEMLHEKRAGRSIRAFSAIVGVSSQHLSDVLSGKRDPGPKVLRYLRVRKAPPQPTIYLVSGRA